MTPATYASGQAILLDVTRKLAATLDLSTILQAAVDGVTEFVGLQTAAVYLREGQELRLGATTPPLPPDFPEHLRTAPLEDHPHIQRAMESGEPLLIEDFSAAALTPAERLVAEQRHLRTVLVVPLMADGKATGAFIVGSRELPSQLAEEEIDLSLALGGLTALAVHNARLYVEGRERAAELARNLEERHRLEAELLQAQKMESVGRLAGGVAHDFNNMLAVILGHVELLLEGPEPATQHTEELQQIRGAAERAANLTRQLLTFARKQTISPRSLDLDETITSMLKLLRRLIGEDIDLVWAPAGDLGRVRMDPAQVDQILANLCVNSREAIAGVGRITIRTRSAILDRASCDEHPGIEPGEYAVLSVADDGCGMDAATQARIFDPFFTTRAAGQGTGLGLSTVYGIVSQNGGLIRIYSEIGQGTTMEIFLPRDVGHDEGEVQVDLDPATFDGDATILLVEDEAMVLALVSAMLRSFGYTVLEADRPVVALRMGAEHAGTVDLLVTDVVMPAMDGRELARRLEAHNPALRTLFISGYTAAVVADRGVLHDGVHLLAKPFTRAQLAAAVHETLK